MIDWQSLTIDEKAVGRTCGCMRCKAERYDMLVEALRLIEYASRKDSLTENERLQSVRTVVCTALSWHGHAVGGEKQS